MIIRSIIIPDTTDVKATGLKAIVKVDIGKVLNQSYPMLHKQNAPTLSIHHAMASASPEDKHLVPRWDWRYWKADLP